MQQGLPFHCDGEECCDSNFVRLFYLYAEDDNKLVDWIHRKTDKYTSADIQNEMVKVMALRILQQIAASLQSTSFFTVMANETTEVSNVEPVVVLQFEKRCSNRIFKVLRCSETCFVAIMKYAGIILRALQGCTLKLRYTTFDIPVIHGYSSLDELPAALAAKATALFILEVI